MPEPVGITLARIDENVIHMKDDLKAHIEKDERLLHEVIRPMWEKHQQDIGAKKNITLWGSVGGYIVNACIAGLAAFGVLKGLGK